MLFTESIQGEKGESGSDGSDGAPGEKGHLGDDGAPGEKSDPGGTADETLALYTLKPNYLMHPTCE